MNNGQRQIIAEKVSSTVRVLELLGLEYEITRPRRERAAGNKSPRVVKVDIGAKRPLRVYNSASGNTWANGPSGAPVKGVKSVEDLYAYLRDLRASW